MTEQRGEALLEAARERRVQAGRGIGAEMRCWWRRERRVQVGRAHMCIKLLYSPISVGIVPLMLLSAIHLRRRRRRLGAARVGGAVGETHS